MLATMTAGVGLAALAALALLLTGAVFGVLVAWWRRRHDDPWFASVEALVPLELIPDCNDELEAALSSPSSSPSFAPSPSFAASPTRAQRAATVGTRPQAPPSVGDRRGSDPTPASTVRNGRSSGRSRSRRRTRPHRSAARTGVLMVLTLGLLAGRRSSRPVG